jgi:flagellar protein FliL
MSAATAAADAPAPAKGKKKLILIVAVLVLVLGGGGAAAMLMMKKKPHDAEGDDDHAPPPAAVVKRDPHAVPTFVPLDPFTVNLADRDAERYAQVGVTLEIQDAKIGEQIKTYMPAIRNRILMAIADRSAAELLNREGKTKLAEKIRRETSRALGVELDDDDEEAAPDEEEAKPAKAGAKKKKKKREPALPVTAVHFSNFIVQ